MEGGYPDPGDLLPIPLAPLIHAQTGSHPSGRGKRNPYHERWWRGVSVTRSNTLIADGAGWQDCLVHWLRREPAVTARIADYIVRTARNRALPSATRS